MPSNILKISNSPGAVSKWRISAVISGTLFTVRLFISKAIKGEGKLDLSNFT
jgi:hypothetical protein